MLQKVFITKYALTSGISEINAEVKETPEHFKKRCYVRTNGLIQGFYNDDFHLTKEEALIDAEKKRKKKIESLKKQIEKLERLTF